MAQRFCGADWIDPGSVRGGCLSHVAGPRLGCDFGVALGGVVAVAEQFGDKGRWRRYGEALLSLARVIGPPDCQGDGTTVARY